VYWQATSSKSPCTNGVVFPLRRRKRRVDPDPAAFVMSRFIEDLHLTAENSPRGLTSVAGASPQRQTWAEVGDRARHMAGALSAHGIGPGGSVLVLAGRAWDVAPLVQAAWICNAAVTILQQPTGRTDLGHWIDDTLRAARVLGSSLVVVGEPCTDFGPVLAAAGLDVVSLGALDGGDAMAPCPTAETDIALRQLTSGSTGAPKAVEISFQNLTAMSRAMQTVLDCDPEEDVLVSWLPLFHDMGMILFVVWPMQLGLEIVSTTPDHFIKNPRVWPDLIGRYRGTITAGPDFSYAVLNRILDSAAPGTFDLSSLRVAVNGGEPINFAEIRRFTELGAQFKLRPEVPAPSYGMAEATLAVTSKRWREIARGDRISLETLISDKKALPATAEAGSTTVTSVGTALPGVEIRIMGESGECEARGIGAIEIRGDILAKRYVTEDGPVELSSPDGWFDTGDVGYLDDDAHLHICGRRKDIIIIGGNNIHPTEIERAASTVTGVRKGNVAAVAIAASDSAREGFAVLAESSLHDDRDHCLRIVSEVIKVVTRSVGYGPRSVQVFAPGTLPKTTSGKLQRAQAAELVDLSG
jgi:fatty-acyl-CoA synthase